MEQENINEDYDPSDIYSRKSDKKDRDFKPGFMKRGATTEITMGSQKFTVVDPTIVDSMIQQIYQLQNMNSHLKEQARLQNIKITELVQKVNEQSQRINKIVADISKNSWRDNGLS